MKTEQCINDELRFVEVPTEVGVLKLLEDTKSGVVYLHSVSERGCIKLEEKTLLA